uniref:Protein osiris 12 n=1 Tax=Bracon brevicornis TaxID=1563983 RepID=A0A6V7LFR1_9HYME
MDLKCVFLIIAIIGVSFTSATDESFFDKGYKTLYRIYETCQQTNGGAIPCLKKKAITFIDRLGRIDSLPITDSLELVRAPGTTYTPTSDIDSLGRSGASKDDMLTEMLFERISSLMNGYNVQIRLPKTSSDELQRSMVEGRGKMKKMMGMMMTGMAMKMAAMVPLAMGALFLLAGKALIISKIALVLSMIIGLKKLLSQKQGGDSHGGWQSGGGGGGWDRSLKNVPQVPDSSTEFAQKLAYHAQKPQ